MGNSTTKFQDYLKNPNEHTIFLKEVDFGEVRDILKNLDITKSGDLYGISPKLIQCVANEMAPNLAMIVNTSFRFGKFPDILKVAKVIPIYKNDSKLEPGNYRPISLLPIFGKVFEKLMFSRIYSFIEKNNIIAKIQFGFQPGKSTEHALLQLQSKILDAFEKKLPSCTIFLDFAKAFDTVNHKILLSKLDHYGITGNAQNWLSSYLTGRQQCVQVGNSVSDLRKINHGVPQGSILGPLLFLLYINDIVNASSKLEFLLFADDTCLFFKHKNVKILESTFNEELINISNWLKANKLSLNVKKSMVLFFRKGLTKEPFQLKIEDTNLDEVESAKYLGMLIDNKLSFKEHIAHVLSKLNKGNAILAKLRYFTSEEITKNIYHAHVESHLHYGLLVWGAASPYLVNNVMSRQKKAIKIMKFVKKREHIELPFRMNKILPVHELRAMNTAKAIWKLLNGETLFLNNMIKLHGLKHNDRDHLKLLVPAKNSRQARLSIFYAGARGWNKIPLHIRKSKSLGILKRTYRNYLISQLKG